MPARRRGTGQPGRRSWRSRPRRLLVELLERRHLLSVLPVTTTANEGPGSLRQAILDANAAPPGMEIGFEIPSGDPGFLDVDADLPGGDPDPDVFVISLESELPALANGITINGHSQRDSGGDTNPFGPEIVLRGASDGAFAGVRISSKGNQVLGLNLQGFSEAGTVVYGDDNLLAGNYIGTDPTGSEARGNGRAGVVVYGSGNTIGGIEPGQGNTIAHNHGPGVTVADGEGNTIRGNAIHGNQGLSIDLGSPGETRNDPLDRDAGANELQNSPEISLAETAAGNTTRVVGVLRAAPNQKFVLDFYAASEAAASTGESVAERHLGSAIVETDAAGERRFDEMLDGEATRGDRVVSTATNKGGSTSEFSRPVVVGGLWERSFRELSALADELGGAARDARAALGDDSFLDRLAGEIGDKIAEVLEDSPRATSETVARAVNDHVEEFFRAERDAKYRLDDMGPDGYIFGPDEYIVVWGNNVRFLLHTPDVGGAGGRVGFDEHGEPIQGEVPGANLIDDGTGVFLAVVPAEHAGELLSKEFVWRFGGLPVLPDMTFSWNFQGIVARSDDLPVLPDLTYTLELEGTAGINQAGVIALGAKGTKTLEWDDVEKESPSLDLSDVLTGEDMIAEELNWAAVERVEEAFANLEDVDTNLLLLWFDPIDYLLADQLGRTSRHVTGLPPVDQMPGSFYASNGFTELLVVPNARLDVYTLDLVGLGQGYRGAANFFQAGWAATALLQGRLDRDLPVQIDFRGGNIGSPFSGLGFLSQSGRLEEGRRVTGPGIGLAETAIFGESSKSRPLILASAGELGIDVSGFDDTGSGGEPTEAGPAEEDETSGQSEEEGGEKRPGAEEDEDDQEPGIRSRTAEEDGEEAGESEPARREVRKATDGSREANGQREDAPAPERGEEGHGSGEGGSSSDGTPAPTASLLPGRAEALAPSDRPARRGKGDGREVVGADPPSLLRQGRLPEAAVRRIMADPDFSVGRSSGGLIAAAIGASSHFRGEDRSWIGKMTSPCSRRRSGAA